MKRLIGIDPLQSNLKMLGHISYFLHGVVAIGAVRRGARQRVLLLIAFALDNVEARRSARQLAGVAIQLEDPQRPLGRRPVPDHVAALAAVAPPVWIAWARVPLWFSTASSAAG